MLKEMERTRPPVGNEARRGWKKKNKSHFPKMKVGDGGH